MADSKSLIGVKRPEAEAEAEAEAMGLGNFKAPKLVAPLWSQLL